MRNRLDSRSLVAFVAVAEALSFRQAADVLHVSQPPLSRTIKELELRLGVSLFDRDKRGVKLTAAGELLLPRARRILRLMQDAEAQLLALPGRKEIRLGLTNAVEYGNLTKTLVRGAEKRGTIISTVRLFAVQMPSGMPSSMLITVDDSVRPSVITIWSQKPVP